MKQIGIIKKEYKFFVVVYDGMTILEISDESFKSFDDAIPLAYQWSNEWFVPVNNRIKEVMERETK